MNKKVNIAIFASGGGSNAEQIIQHFKTSDKINVRLVVTNSATAGVIQRAEKHGIESQVHPYKVSNIELINELKKCKIDLIVLAGYLKKIDTELIKMYPNKIVNIHPALLPKFGGKGMYGMNVHRAVVAAEEEISGPTIHYVNENYDEGAIIEQHSCVIEKNDTPEDVQKKVLKLEHQFFAPCIERLILEE